MRTFANVEGLGLGVPVPSWTHVVRGSSASKFGGLLRGRLRCECNSDDTLQLDDSFFLVALWMPTTPQRKYAHGQATNKQKLLVLLY
jgi:hypothetical protein